MPIVCRHETYGEAFFVLSSEDIGPIDELRPSTSATIERRSSGRQREP
jgi:hypothetical protein